jgi:two-component system sensor histidine kinase/response regulator
MSHPRGVVVPRPMLYNSANIRVSSTTASVWVVDDSTLHGEVFRRALIPQYDVSVFGGGAAMLETLASGDAPDVLLLDWFMPDMSGAEVCRFVRERMNFAKLPILVVTAIGTSDDLLDALSAGANDFVHKTVTSPELNARVAGLVRMARLHASLTEAERKLRVEAVFRERFMGMLAHDLRQPLSTVITACDLLLELDASDKAVGVIQRQLRAAQRMRRMVTDLLDFSGSRPETGMPVQKRWEDLAEIARTSLDEIRAANPQRALDLGVEGSCQGHWDSDRLAQVLSNLVGNALAHGDPDGPVEVRLRGRDAAVELRVSNRGPTIPSEILSNLFQPYHRVRTARRASDGVGLGLHIVQQIVHAHGGTLAAHSRDGETHFLVTLPREERSVATSSNLPSGG